MTSCTRTGRQLWQDPETQEYSQSESTLLWGASTCHVDLGALPETFAGHIAYIAQETSRMLWLLHAVTHCQQAHDTHLHAWPMAHWRQSYKEHVPLLGIQGFVWHTLATNLQLHYYHSANTVHAQLQNTTLQSHFPLAR